MQTTGLRYFLAVARTGSIAAASARLNVASSAISRQIANLESELGCVLFERRPRGMVPSPAGALLADHAHNILTRADQATEEIRSLRGTARGLVRVAAAEGFALDIVPATMAAFMRRFPGVRFELSVTSPLNVTQRVATGEVDVGITFVFNHSASVQIVHDARAEMVGICAVDHPLAGARRVPLSAFADYPVVLMSQDTTSRQAFDLACRDERIAIEPAMAVNTLPAILSFVRQTRAIGPAGFLSVQSTIRRREIAFFTLENAARLARPIQIQTMRDRSLPDSVRLFVEDLVAAVSVRTDQPV